ncbi:hypothetical protein DERF_001261 [Dermatophagoides farinae]|uniref:Uncharacterized protein n=1 Tax=Dermatophagoides farinae TaxID=6954 RepID=A0A922LCX5_DERFA|nr:hypothetical protein DERF_001261 [Dermatophagoides farinae]
MSLMVRIKDLKFWKNFSSLDYRLFIFISVILIFVMIYSLTVYTIMADFFDNEQNQGYDDNQQAGFDDQQPFVTNMMEMENYNEQELRRKERKRTKRKKRREKKQKLKRKKKAKKMKVKKKRKKLKKALTDFRRLYYGEKVLQKQDLPETTSTTTGEPSKTWIEHFIDHISNTPLEEDDDDGDDTDGDTTVEKTESTESDEEETPKEKKKKSKSPTIDKSVELMMKMFEEFNDKKIFGDYQTPNLNYKGEQDILNVLQKEFHSPDKEQQQQQQQQQQPQFWQPQPLSKRQKIIINFVPYDPSKHQQQQQLQQKQPSSPSLSPSSSLKVKITSEQGIATQVGNVVAEAMRYNLKKIENLYPYRKSRKK